MAGLYDLLPEGLLSQLGGGLPQMNQAAAGLNQQSDQQQQAPQQPQQPDQSQGGGAGFQGILNSAGIHTDGLLGRVGNALMAAGSEDPAAAILQLNKARREQAEASKPKVTPLADGAFSMVTFPDGRTQIMKNADVANFLTDKQERTYQQALQKVLLSSQAGTQAANDKVNFKELEEKAGGPNAPTVFNPEVQSSIDKMNGVADWLQKGGDNVPGLGNNPMAADAIDRTIGRATGNQNYEQRRWLDRFVGQNVLDAAKSMKGALSDKDVIFLKGIQPKPDDPTDMKIKYLQEFGAALKRKEEERMQAATDLKTGNTNAPRPNGGAAPQIMDEAQVKSSGLSYDPNYEYAMVNGQLMKRKKGN